MHPFHSPLGLRNRVPVPDTRMDTLPLVTVLLLAIILSLAGSRFLYSPGLTMALDHSTDPAHPLQLPTVLPLPVSSHSPLPGAVTDATLTVFSAKSDNLFIFEGHIYTFADEQLKRDLQTAAHRSPVLLLKADRSLSLQTLFRLTDLAREAGFKQVQIAGESRPE